MKSKQIDILMGFAKTWVVSNEDIDYGLCSLANIYEEMARYAKDWKHYSGCANCPVEGNYSDYLKDGKYSGKRGKRRRSLARFIANKLRHEIHMSKWHI